MAEQGTGTGTSTGAGAAGSGAGGGTGAGGAGTVDPKITFGGGSGDSGAGGAGTGTGGSGDQGTGAGGAGDQGDKTGGTKTGAEDKFEFDFDGEKFTPEAEEQGSTGGNENKDTYDSSKAFDPKLEEALKANPELLKATKNLHYENRRWKQTGFKNPEDLKAHTDRVNKMGGLDKIETTAAEWDTAWKGFQAGDPKVADKWYAENPEGLTKLLPHLQQKVAQMNPGVYAHEMSKVFMATIMQQDKSGSSVLTAFNQLVDLTKDNPDAQKLLGRIGETFEDVAGHADKAPASSGNTSKFKEQETSLAKRERNLYIQSVNTKLRPKEISAAEQVVRHLTKGKNVSKDTFNDIVKDVLDHYGANQTNDPTFRANMKDLLAQNNTEGVLKSNMSYITKNMMPAGKKIIRKYTGLSSTETNTRKVEGQQQREGAAGGSTGDKAAVKYNGQLVQGGPPADSIDYNAMRAKYGRKGTGDRLLDRKFIHKNGTEMYW